MLEFKPIVVHFEEWRRSCNIAFLHHAYNDVGGSHVFCDGGCVGVERHIRTNDRSVSTAVPKGSRLACVRFCGVGPVSCTNFRTNSWSDSTAVPECSRLVCIGKVGDDEQQKQQQQALSN